MSYNNYRQRAFEHHDKKCIVCGETRVFDVHHIDSNHENNTPINLCVLCPTCHRLYHSKEHKYLVEAKILEYKELFEDYYFNQNTY